MTELTTQHPMLACVAQLGAVLDEAADLQPVYLSAAQKGDALRELAALEARVTALRLRVMAVADDTAEATGARDIAAWWTAETRADDPRPARADQTLALSRDRERPVLSGAFSAGRCSVAQARVVARALDELPDDVGQDVLTRAEATLVEQAAHHRPEELAALGRRILQVVAPEIADEQEARRLADIERHARHKTRLTLRPLGDGTTRLSGRLPDASAHRLKTYLEAFTSPRHAQPGVPQGPDERLPYPRRLGHAFCALLERLDPATLPAHGGDATTVIVTMTLDQLTSELGTAALLDGMTDDAGSAMANLTAAEARRLACTARIVPAVLGGDSEILDVGMAARLFTRAQRKALRIRDQRCRAEGCTIPPAWCEAHHLKPWQLGGPTDLANGVLLCSHHHHLAHDHRYAHERRPNGDLRFVRRT